MGRSGQPDRLARISCKDVRDLIASRKTTGDFGNAIEVIQIGDCFPFRVFAKNRGPATFDFCNTIGGIADMAPKRWDVRF